MASPRSSTRRGCGRTSSGLPTGSSATRESLAPLLWSRWGHVWRAAQTPDAIASEATEDLRGGDVLLLHDADHYSQPDCWRGTVAALPAILDTIETAGLATAPFAA